MTAIFMVLRELNGAVCRLAGLTGLLVAFAAYRLDGMQPGALPAVFGDAEMAGYALIALPALSLVFLSPGLTRLAFHGRAQWRLFRGLAQLSAMAGLLMLAGMSIEALLGPGRYTVREPVLLLSAQIALGMLALTWLGRETGLAADAGSETTPTTVEQVRALRRMRSPRR